MMGYSLKKKATKGVLWNAIEKFAVQGVQFVLGIVLARILVPEDYGLIGMLAIFIAISQWFIDSGFSTALIQKKNRTSIDFSTVFYFNIIVSVLLYLILYIASPYISIFYDEPKLTLLTRVLSLNIIISAFSIIQNTRLTIDLDFKSIAISNFSAVIISGIIGIAMAYNGFGVWALVTQNIVRAIALALILWFLSKWKPEFVFSYASFKQLFRFGSRLLGAGMIATVLRNIYSMTIGKFFNSAELGFFTRAKDFTDLTSETVTSILSKVTFPVLSELQDDPERMVAAYKRLVRMSAFVIFPVMGLLAAIAEPFIRILLTEKWIAVVPLLQLLCIARVLTPMSTLNMNILNVIGRSDLFLKLDIVKVPVILGALFLAIPYGVKAVVIGHVISSVISYLINTYYSSKFYSYGALNQLKEVWLILLSTSLMIFAVYGINNIFENDLAKLLISIPLAGIVYLFLAYLFKVEEVRELKVIAYSLLRK